MIFSKKGSHVGMIVSFALFVTMLLALLTISNFGVSEQPNKQALLEYLEVALIAQFSDTLTTTSLYSISRTNPQSNCFTFDQYLSEITGDYVVVAKDDSNTRVPATLTETAVIIEDKNSPSITLLYSKQFDALETNNFCPQQLRYENPKQFEIGFSRTKDAIFLQNIIQTFEKYQSPSGYDELRSILNVPQGTEFGFALLDRDRNVINNPSGKPLDTQPKEFNPQTNVFSKEVYIEYFDESGNTNLGIIRIDLW